jgi:hypothetical protein
MVDKKSAAIGAAATVVSAGVVYGVVKLIKWFRSEKKVEEPVKKAA